MGKAKKVYDTATHAKLTGLKDKITSFEAIDLEEFHQKLCIEWLSACNFDGWLFKFGFINHKLCQCWGIGNEDAFIISSQGVKCFDAFLYAHGIFTGQVIGLEERIWEEVDGFTD